MASTMSTPLEDRILECKTYTIPAVIYPKYMIIVGGGGEGLKSMVSDGFQWFMGSYGGWGMGGGVNCRFKNGGVSSRPVRYMCNVVY